MIDANSFYLGFICGGVILFALGVGCTWRWWQTWYTEKMKGESDG